MVINSAISGKAVRLELSNEYAKNDIKVGAVTVANCDKNGSFLDTYKTVTVNGQSSFVIKKGGIVKTDPVDFSVEVDGYF